MSKVHTSAQRLYTDPKYSGKQFKLVREYVEKGDMGELLYPMHDVDKNGIVTRNEFMKVALTVRHPKNFEKTKPPPVRKDEV